MIKVSLVIPCYNEELRIEQEKFCLLLREAINNDIDLQLHFVNDGSIDNTREIIGRLILEEPKNCFLINLETNVGKAEVIRKTMLTLCDSDRDYLGFIDADFAVPPLAVLRFTRTALLFPEYEYFFASRIPLLGSRIQRNGSRHLSGRLFNYVIRARLKLNIYDSQCGLKLLKNTTKLQASLKEPVTNPWLFDVVLLQRLLEESDQKARQKIGLELPVIEWSDIPGSKVTILSGLRSLLRAARI
jgi:dolichyl-phosphate beta-glucosyltransferase